MTKNIEYIFYDGENTTTVDRNLKKIMMYERSGWSRAYSITFKELLKNSKDWGVKVKLGDSDEFIAEVATNIILANNAVLHGLDPFRYIPKIDKITDPRALDVLKSFEAILVEYGSAEVLAKMSKKSKDFLKSALK